MTIRLKNISGLAGATMGSEPLHSRLLHIAQLLETSLILIAILFKNKYLKKQFLTQQNKIHTEFSCIYPIPSQSASNLRTWKKVHGSVLQSCSRRDCQRTEWSSSAATFLDELDRPVNTSALEEFNLEWSGASNFSLRLTSEISHTDYGSNSAPES